jgi:exopolysaccharide production protein ExoZ
MANTAPAINNPVVAEIQLFRGLAALLVALYHLTGLFLAKFDYHFMASFFEFGFSGVDLFFVISGFIILYVHENDMGNASRLVGFIKKRLIRIYPMYWLVTLAILPVYFVAPSFGVGFETELKSIILSLFLLPQDHFPILAVGWTLSYELLFYCVFGLAIIFSKRTALTFSVAWMALTVYFIFPNWFGQAPHELAFLGVSRDYLFSRFYIEFFSGCLIVYLLRTHLVDSLKVWIFCAGVVWFAAAALNQQHLRDWFGAAHSFLGYGVPSFLLILGSQCLNRFSDTLMYKLFYQLGEASYSIYLVHYVMFSVLVKLMANTGLVPLLGATSCSVIVILTTLYICYWISRLVERPLTTYLRGKLLQKKPAGGRPVLAAAID